MPLDRVRVEETIAWLSRAHLDLQAARVDLDADPPLAEDALFHCQQAIEKALKGFLTWHDEPFRKTHSLVELGLQCAEIESDLMDLLKRAAPLSEYATKYRYPGDVIPGTSEEAAASLLLAAEVLEQIMARVPSDLPD